ncbi:heavy-metal-associated domain-containing protein [Chitinophaga horti]|uniref:Heavy-metal-associated domain-containing protein n=1 Tax=Chitinophaga horti TaxID=2920382 RepID=A0ABY6JAD5_9BACT|nr:heavy-metal-associated domain-containing protein [Chitinophaga horti]UYQ95297.1 heavy-metal-associated domain-containing protein [Chitinophaga horti]
MNSMKFKTNLKCGGCVATVTPFLDKLVGHDHWQVDLADAQKTLTVDVEKASAEEVEKAVQEAGFKAEKL